MILSENRDIGQRLERYARKKIEIGTRCKLPRHWHGNNDPAMMTCVGIYPHYAVFETKRSIRACFRWFELGVALKTGAKKSE